MKNDLCRFNLNRIADHPIEFARAIVGNHEQRLDLPTAEEMKLTFDYNTLVRHGKGAVGLYLQARRLGTEKFLSLQRELLQDYKYHPLTLSAFTIDNPGRRVAEQSRIAMERSTKGVDGCNDAVNAIDAFMIRSLPLSLR